jgi:fibronectin-binding autotransporter adhesin
VAHNFPLRLTGTWRGVLALAAVLVGHGTGAAAPLDWDGSGSQWGIRQNWSELESAATPDPVTFPGASDVATFGSAIIASAQTVELAGAQAALGIATNSSNTFLTMIRGGAAAQTLELGASGIMHSGGGLSIGSTIPGQEVDLLIASAQTWTSSSTGAGAAGLQIANSVVLGIAGNQTLTLSGSNSDAGIAGAIMDGAGALGLAKSGTGLWTLAGANSYTGPTVVSAGTLALQNNRALGSMGGGTTVTFGGKLTLTNVAISGEPLTLQGPSLLVNAGGALENINGSSTWTGNISILPAQLTRIVSNEGFLSISGNISLSPNSADIFVLGGTDDGEVSGVISGSSVVTRGSGGRGSWTWSGANTYTGKTRALSGQLIVSSLNRVVGGSPSSNLGAPKTVANGTIDLGGILKYVGSGEETDRNFNLTNTDFFRGINQSGTGLLKLTGNIASEPAAGRIRLMGSTSGVGEISGAINGTESIIIEKWGSGTWRLSGANTQGSPALYQGALELDLSTNRNGVLPSSAGIFFSNASRLLVLGASTGSSVQSVSSLSVSGGSSRLRIDPSGGTDTTLSIRGATVSTGADLRIEFDYTAGTTNGEVFGNNIVAWNANLTNGIIGPGYIVKDSGGTGFATVRSGKVVRFVPTLGLPSSSASATEHYVLDSNGDSSTPGSLHLQQTATQSIHTLTINPSASAGVLSLGATVLNLDALATNGSSINPFEIAAGASGGIRAAIEGAALRIEHHSGGILTVSAPILENAAGGLSRYGSGTIILGGANTYSGPTNLYGGLTQLRGPMGSTSITIRESAVLQIDSSLALTSANRVLFGVDSDGRLQLQGHDLTIGSLSTSLPFPEFIYESPRPHVFPTLENGGATSSTLTLALTSGASFYGSLRDGSGGGRLAITIRAENPDTSQLFDGVQTYTGDTHIESGILYVSGALTGSTVIVGDPDNPSRKAMLVGRRETSLRETGNGQEIGVKDIVAVTPGAVVDPSAFYASTLSTNSFSLTNSARLAIQISDKIVGGGLVTSGYDRVNVMNLSTSAVVGDGLLELKDTSTVPLPADALLFIVVNHGSGPPSELFAGVTLGGKPVARINDINGGGPHL